MENGIRRFRGYVHDGNRPMQELLESFGAHVELDGPGVLRVTVELPRGEQLRGSSAYQVLGALARGEGPRLVRWGGLWQPKASGR
jgi:hypothetical protein